MVRSLIFSRWGHGSKPCNYGDMVRMLIKLGHTYFNRNGFIETQVIVFLNFKEILLEHTALSWDIIISFSLAMPIFYGRSQKVIDYLAAQIFSFLGVCFLEDFQCLPLKLKPSTASPFQPILSCIGLAVKLGLRGRFRCIRKWQLWP